MSSSISARCPHCRRVAPLYFFAVVVRRGWYCPACFARAFALAESELWLNQRRQ